MPTTELPDTKTKAHEIARRIANERPLKKDKDAPEAHVSGGFNQKSHQEVADHSFAATKQVRGSGDAS